MKNYFPILLTVLATCSPLRAEFVFENKLVKTTAAPDAKVVKVEFPFTVKGEATKITGYDAPCTCLAARVEPTNKDGSAKLVWQPGESGKIVAKFDMGNFKGTVDKGIVLNTDQKGEAHELILRVTIPVLLEIDPPTQKWELDGKGGERVFNLTVQGDEKVEIIENSGTNNEIFPYTFETLEPGRKYRVTVKPSSVAEPGFGMIRVKTDSDNPKYQNAQMFLVIKKKP